MRRSDVALPILLSILLGLFYLLYTSLSGEGLAFPLDDAWIHQTYARSLALSGEWSFVPGQPSAGSTAPLWTVALAAGVALGVDGIGWSYGLGILLLALTGLAAGALAAQLFPGRPRLRPAVALFCVAEWHLGWAAVSGMETLLFTALSLALLRLAVAAPGRWTGLGLGVLGGLLTLTRPEGVLLFALCCAALGWQRLRTRSFRLLARDAVAAGLAFAVLLAPLVWFNYSANGTPFPNTFGAKQQEYRVLLQTPYLLRWLQLAATTLVGPGVLMLPGLLVVVRRMGNRQWAVGSRVVKGDRQEAASPLPIACCLLPALWWVILISLYAWRLPVTYQHGRYLIPAIPILVVYGMAGLAGALDWRARGGLRWVFSRTAVALLLAVPAAFAVVGARAYRDDVALINRGLVAAAQWVRDHTAPGALVAAHDVGALGYFAGRPLVDLAGLVSPEAIPFLGDAEAAAVHVRARGAAYLVQGMGFEYPAITGAAGAERVYDSGNLQPGKADDRAHVEIYRLK